MNIQRFPMTCTWIVTFLLAFSASLNKEERPIQTIPVYSVEWKEESLETTLEWCQTKYENLIIDWKRLEAEGVGRDTPITLQLTKKTTEQILKNILEQIKEPLRCYTIDGVSKVSTKKYYDDIQFVEVYHVADIIARIPNFEGPEVSLSEEQGQGQTSPFSGEGQEKEEENKEPDAEEVAELIQKVVEPDSWAANGGKNTISPWENCLVVKASIEVHEIIGGSRIWTQKRSIGE